VRYYVRENTRRYEEMTRMGLTRWVEKVYGGTNLEDFSSCDFLEFALPRLRFEPSQPTALELGCGVGPGAVFLAERGFRVTGYDVIPEAIEAARRIAANRGLTIDYEVMDVTRIPHDGERFDLIVDSYCLNHIMFANERRAVLDSVKARLEPDGYFLLSTSVYYRRRHQPETKIVDAATGIVYDSYDDDCLYDPETDYYYEPLANFPSEREKTEVLEDLIVVNGITYIPKRCYRDAERLRAELAAHGLATIRQYGEYTQDSINVHAGGSRDVTRGCASMSSM